MYALLNGISTKLFLAILTCLALTACNQSQPTQARTPEQTAASIAKKQADREAAKRAEAAMAALSSDELRKLASTAFREQRLYAPAGNNAVEYYLAIRKKSSEPDVLTESALMDLTPYTVIAAEQAISLLDFTEATRLRDLIAQVDANAPAIPRISQAISEGLKNTEVLAQAEAQLEKDKSLVAENVASQESQAAVKPFIEETSAKPATTPIQTATTQTPLVLAPAQTTQAPATPARAVASPPIQVKKSELIAIRTPEPDFPSDAWIRGLSGAVEVEFIVQRSGEVSEVRVVNSSQRAFDRNVVTTVKRWKFAPMEEPMTVRRSFNFNNPST
jgi:protein TonB